MLGVALQWEDSLEVAKSLLLLLIVCDDAELVLRKPGVVERVTAIRHREYSIGVLELLLSALLCQRVKYLIYSFVLGVNKHAVLLLCGRVQLLMLLQLVLSRIFIKT